MLYIVFGSATDGDNEIEADEMRSLAASEYFEIIIRRHWRMTGCGFSSRETAHQSQCTDDLAQEDNGDFVADQNSETPPVKIVFVSRGGDSNISPLDTNSQNLDQFATSSVPYTDGQSRERDVVQFPPPDITDRTTIEEAVAQIIDGDATSQEF